MEMAVKWIPLRSWMTLLTDAITLIHLQHWKSMTQITCLIHPYRPLFHYSLMEGAYQFHWSNGGKGWSHVIKRIRTSHVWSFNLKLTREKRNKNAAELMDLFCKSSKLYKSIFIECNQFLFQFFLNWFYCFFCWFNFDEKYFGNCT